MHGVAFRVSALASEAATTRARELDERPPPPAGAEAADGALSDEEITRPRGASGLRRRVIKRGDYVVHRDIGVARFRGVLTARLATADRAPGKYLVLEFANERMEVPTSDQHMLSLYRRADEAALRPVKLSSTARIKAWETKKARAKASLKQLTVGILEAYRARAQLRRPTCPPDGAAFDAFVANCSFTLTDDQAAACEQVRRDMTERPQPMDRLICGDVGFGKTEVAMHALFRMASSGRQCAVLTPTTVLAWQHHATMSARMPTLRVALLTRLTPARAARELLARVEAGEVDVLVGTHAILSKRVSFRRLGLLVVDEEHRFGVNQKDKLKALALDVDYVTMSATPIPRTLSLGLSALRDMSVLNTPPPGRRPVTTICERFSPRVVERAIGAELERGGQAFYVVPRIAHVADALELLRGLFPDAPIEWAHGQCADLEERMLCFANGTARVLVSTSVVECGIDMPAVNTLVIERAHMFGLASLHQLRGRVGRSSAQAYAYMLTGGDARLTPEADARLTTLQHFSALGDGFELAQADMALRGCGNLLGAEQSGQINDVGAEYFFEMLEEAIEGARARVATDGVGLERSRVGGLKN
ncbi:hypothetical protein KFE25_004831 [Diacronema lutheri]|uniref:Transcription-repair coupling factor n=1 Tax=Diacronema lutheri TaxID=2081491 RepID=A0A8J5XHQ7_DIALT|nr:hypothetical protein KFE25_004831 [Diacronema lutheri]